MRTSAAAVPQTSPMVNAIIVSFPNVDPQKANASGMEAKGAALAESILRDVAEKLVTGKRFLTDIAALDNPGRTAMRAAFKDHLAAFREEAKQWKDTNKAPLFQKRNNVLSVRTSEYVRFSQACDAGFTPDMDDGYAEILAAARCFLDGTADMGPESGGDAVGPMARRGRKSASKMDKFLAYLGKLAPTLDDLIAFEKVLRASIKATRDEEAHKATEQATEQASA